MESLAPPIRLLLIIKKSLDRGSSVRMGLTEYLKNTGDSWREEVLHWSSQMQQGLDTHLIIESQKTIYRQQLLLLLERGLKGESIYTHLLQLEIEMAEQVENQIEEFTARLPYLLLVPLALFLFPACLILMLGPLILQLTHSF